MINEEGGVDPEQFRMDAMYDRMDCIGKSVLGLTIQCAQCHNHKYDPTTQEEYYRMFAFINNDHEAQRVVYTPEEQMSSTLPGVSAALGLETAFGRHVGLVTRGSYRYLNSSSSRPVRHIGLRRAAWDIGLQWRL